VLVAAAALVDNNDIFPEDPETLVAAEGGHYSIRPLLNKDPNPDYELRGILTPSPNRHISVV